MPRIRPALLVLLLATVPLAPSASTAQTRTAPVRRELRSELEWDGRECRVINRRFMILEGERDREPEPPRRHRVLEETFAFTTCTDAEESGGDVTAVVRWIDREEPLFTIRGQGYARIGPTGYAIRTQYWCDEGDHVERHYSLDSGALLFASTQPVLVVNSAVPAPHRFVAYQETCGGHALGGGLRPYESDPAVVGALHYGDRSTPAARLLVVAAGASWADAVDEVSVVGAREHESVGGDERWVSVAAPTTDLTIRIRFDAGEGRPAPVLEVPVAGGRFDVARARVPPGITLRADR